MAIVGEKESRSNSRPWASWMDFGTDGGTHNFLRYIENWDETLYYEGSIVSMYYNHQAVGTFKCCTTVTIRRLVRISSIRTF